VILDRFIEQTRDSINDLDAGLSEMLARLDQISRMAQLSERDFVQVGAIVNNFNYMLLYLESNSAHVPVDYIERYRIALIETLDRDHCFLHLLENLYCAAEECDASRRAFISYLSRRSEDDDDIVEQSLAALKKEANCILDKIRQDKISFLENLGAGVEERRPDAVFYGLLSDVDSGTTRQKLSFAWKLLGARHTPGLQAAIDGVIGWRRYQCTERGGKSVLLDTLSRCSVSEEESRAYWEETLSLSVANHEKLEGEIQTTLGGASGVRADFGRYLNIIRGERRIPPIPLMPCIDYILAVTKTMFGVSAKRVDEVPGHMMTFDMTRDGHDIGRINFDLWDVGPVRRRANTTMGVRNRTDWRGIVQRPVAHVSCRFRKSEDTERFITFQNAHSLLHEFGHAMNHLMITRRLPNLSGLEFLPLERLEILSMWFERWIFHDEFQKFLKFSCDESVGFELSRKIKMLEYRRTHLERALICALDFEVHSSSSDTLEDSYRRIDERFGVSRYCELGEIIEYFTWPMLIANPGAYFAYLWGAGVSASRFRPLMSKRLTEMPRPEETMYLFLDCFTFHASSPRPDPAEIFAFYEIPTSGSTKET
jgi:oligopeptidase A